MMTLSELYSANAEWGPDTEIDFYNSRHGEFIAKGKAMDMASLLAWGDCKVVSFSRSTVLLKDAPELER